VLGIAIVTAAYKTFIFRRLETFLTGDEISAVLQSTESIGLFPTEVQDHVRTMFAGGYNRQFQIMVAFAAAQIPSSVLMWQKNQILV